MIKELYYLAYESRYQSVYEAGFERWGHTPNDEILVGTLTSWVNAHELKGKSVIEFACGEGAGGEILSELGCVYHGVDIAPTAVHKARAALADYENASVSLLDMVNQRVHGTFDAALDCMGLHMLIPDSDRMKYLSNAYGCLRGGAPMLFFRELYGEKAPEGIIRLIEEWITVTGSDYATPLKQTIVNNGKTIEVHIPLVPGRERTKDGYIREMESAGFIIDAFIEMELNLQCPHSVSIFVHKP
ncbi:MAG: class I SAM-dependent methyltransferase [Clostridiales bacterium]|jgi:hypothetical protein|nr:class I SAM-dependent methyltransferase [Clostridiales bacterium]